MNSLLAPLIFGGVLAGLIQFLVDFKGLQVFDPPKAGGTVNSFETAPAGGWTRFVAFLERVWSFVKRHWRFFGYVVIGIAGALLTPLINEWTNGALKGIKPIKDYVDCVSRSPKPETDCPPYSTWYSIVLIGYGIIFGYSAVRIIRSIGTFLLGNITNAQQQRLSETEKKLAEAQKEIEALKAKAAAGAGQPSKPPAFSAEETVQAPYFDDAQNEIDKRTYYAGINLADRGSLVRNLPQLLDRSHTSRLTYNPALHLYPVVDRYPDGRLRGVYSNTAFTLDSLLALDAQVDKARADQAANFVAFDESPDERAARFEEIEAKLPYNCEHVVPQSWFGKREPMKGDLHHLFTCEVNCNEFRGNNKYHEFADYEASGPCGKRETGLFEPERNKGVEARAVLYFLLRYPGVFQHGTGYSGEDLPMLVAWHKSQEVTLYEKYRNQQIQKKQGNRNPFIDFPELVEALDFGAFVTAAEDDEAQPRENFGDDGTARGELSAVAGFEGCAENPTPKPWKEWRAAESLKTLVKQVNALAPGRSKASDGFIGDTAHQSRDSDHNPWVWDAAVKKGVVTAVDVTHDPGGKCDCHTLAKSLETNKDPRIKYVIWNRRIMNSSPIGGSDPWAWRPYDGQNPHDKHIHISVKCTKDAFDSTDPWTVQTT